jgi:hypothetical protein
MLYILKLKEALINLSPIISEMKIKIEKNVTSIDISYIFPNNDLIYHYTATNIDKYRYS